MITFQDFGFDYSYKYDSDVLVGTYAIALKDSLLYSYVSLENGVAYNKKETTPEYGIPNGAYISMDVYELKSSTDSIYNYERIKKYSIEKGKVLSKETDIKAMKLKYLEVDKFIFTANLQDENNANLYEKNRGILNTSQVIRKLLSKTE